MLCVLYMDTPASETPRRIWQSSELADYLDELNELFPDQTEERLIEAKAALDSYLEAAWKQFLRLEREGSTFDGTNWRFYSSDTKVDSHR